MNEDDLRNELSRRIYKQSASDLFSEIPGILFPSSLRANTVKESAFNFEKGQCVVGGIINGFIPFRRHYEEVPFVRVWLLSNNDNQESICYK